MGRFQLLGTLVVLLFVGSLNGQSFNNFYPDNVWNDIAGYPNAVHHPKSESYFLVEYDRQFDIAFNSALHVKKVNELGNLIGERYFVTDFMPYSGHYISGVQVQGEELVVFVNRNVSFPHIHDVFIIRIKLDLSGTPTSKRLYLDGSDKEFNSLKVNEVVPYGNQLLFTGSVLTRGDLNNHADASKLMMGLVNADGTITYQIYQHNLDLLEGLSLLPRPKANELYVSIRYTSKGGKAAVNNDLPAIFKMQIFKNNFYVNWGELYPDLRVDVSNYSSYNEGIEIPLMESYTEEKVPAFVARDNATEEVVFVPFDRFNGDPLTSSVRKIDIPAGVEMIDAVKMSGSNSLAVLFTRKEPYNLWNSESYLLSTTNIFSSFFVKPKWHNLTSPSLTNAIQARRILIPGKEELAIAGLVNEVEYPLSGLYRASLMKSDDLSFECVTRKKLKAPKYVPIESKSILLKLSYVPILVEEREMEFSTSVSTTKFELCGPMFTDESEIENRVGSNNEEINASSIYVYPNPANHQIQVRIPNSKLISRAVVIRNMMGMIVYRETVGMDQTTLSINSSDYPDGVYFLELQSEDNKLSHKRIVITH